MLVNRQRSATLDEMDDLPLMVVSEGPRDVAEADVE